MKIENPLRTFNPLEGQLPRIAQRTIKLAVEATRPHLEDIPYERILAITDLTFNAMTLNEDNADAFNEAYETAIDSQPKLSEVFDANRTEPVGVDFEQAFGQFFDWDSTPDQPHLFEDLSPLAFVSMTLLSNVAALASTEALLKQHPENLTYDDICLNLEDQLHLVIFLYGLMEFITPGTDYLELKRMLQERGKQGGKAKSERYARVKQYCYVQFAELKHFSDREAARRIYAAMPGPLRAVMINSDPQHQIARWLGSHRKKLKSNEIS